MRRGTCPAPAPPDLTAPGEAAVPARASSGIDALPPYEIGEEHPDAATSDAVFEAREALELGAAELMLGRMTSAQLTGWRLLADATVSHVEGDQFVDAAAYTDANAVFHDYLVGLTGNAHLLTAYQDLGVRAHMSTTLAQATWCDPRCPQDHLDLVAAFAAQDREAVRRLIHEHAERSKETTRRAMAEATQSSKPRFITPGRFAGQVVVVTGAGQGIGEAVARRVHAEGGRVALIDRSGGSQAIAEELNGPGEPKALSLQVDMEDPAAVRQMVAEVESALGSVDVLVNNVGGAMAFKPFVEFTDDQVRAEIGRSLMTTLWACHAVLPGMQERRSGTIVNVSSVATRGIHRIPYSAAKGGVNTLTASLAMECAPHGVRVVAAAPGGTSAPPRRVPRDGEKPGNEVEQEWFDAHITQTLESSLMGRYGTLEEQAAVITFLASREAGYVNGTVVPVGGGDQG